MKRHTRRQVLASLSAAGTAGLAGCGLLQSSPSSDGTAGSEPEESPVEQLWSSGTSTEYPQNHHKLGVTRVDDTVVIGMPLSEYPDEVGCGLAAVDGTGGTVRWREQLPKDVCDPHTIGDVASATLDGTPAFVVSTIEGETVAYDAASGDPLFQADLVETIPYSEPVLTPPLSDGTQRVVVMDNNANLVVAHMDGTVDWRYQPEGVGYPAPVVGDIDGDGDVEIVVTSDAARGYVVALGIAGEVLWTAEFESGGRGLVGMDRPERTDIAVSTWEGQVAAIDGRDGTVRWSGEYAVRGILGDYDEEHLYTTEGDGVVHAVDRGDGSLAWSVDSLSTTAPANGPSVGTVTQGGRPIVAGLSYDGTLGIVDARTGTVELEHRFDPDAFTSPRLLDLTGDGREDLVVFFGHGETAAYSLDL